MNWQEIVRSLAHRADSAVDRRRRPRTGIASIAPYRGFGRGNELMIRGRVLMERPITRAREAEPLWRNVLNSYRRFSSAEVPGAKVMASYRDAVAETVADHEGHFQLLLQSEVLEHDSLWHEVGLRLAGGEAAVTGHVVIPPPDARYGVISDIDDTIVQTGATSLRAMIRNVMLQNAAMRTPFEGVADLYRTLHAERNPLFYVSSGPWNLYDVIHDYMDLQGIPAGPILLQDWGFEADSLLMRPHEAHKVRHIQALLDYYPSLPFILIGDSGQHDPEIYLNVMQANPGRITIAIIRDVSGHARDSAVAKIAADAVAAGSEMVYTADSAAALGELTRRGIV